MRDLASEEAELVSRRWDFIPSLADWRNLTTRARTARLAAGGILVVVALLGPHPLKRYGPPFALDVALIYALIVLAVSVLGWIGEISVAVVGQMGMGLVGLNFLYERHHWPFFLALLVVVASSIPFSVVLGMFALRLRGINFAIASLAFGYLAQISIITEYIGADTTEKGTITRPSFLKADDVLYYWILGSMVLVAMACYMIQRSRVGKAIAALRDSETAFWTMGRSRAAYKLLVVCLSGAIATLAGCWFALLLETVPATYYSPGFAIVFFGFALAGGLGSVGGAIAIGVVFAAIPKYLESSSTGAFAKWDFIFYGVLSLLIFMKVPGGLGALGRRVWARVERVEGREP